ncbi:MAG TPA: response regulator [Bacteroidota bacterium]|nr:response regulator [Bacteroidota bacterium]
MKILIVDNDPVYLSLLAEVLRLHSYQVHTAADGEAALAKLREEPFDLVISDISMPKMNGINLHKHVRADEKLRHIPFAWNSGYRELRDIIEVENPALDFKLDKSLPVPTLLYFVATIQKRLEEQSTAAPA